MSILARTIARGCITYSTADTRPHIFTVQSISSYLVRRAKQVDPHLEASILQGDATEIAREVVQLFNSENPPWTKREDIATSVSACFLAKYCQDSFGLGRYVDTSGLGIEDIVLQNHSASVSQNPQYAPARQYFQPDVEKDALTYRRLVYDHPSLRLCWNTGGHSVMISNGRILLYTDVAYRCLSCTDKNLGVRQSVAEAMDCHANDCPGDSTVDNSL